MNTVLKVWQKFWAISISKASKIKSSGILDETIIQKGKHHHHRQEKGYRTFASS